MDELIVVKIGGNVIDDESALDHFLSDFANIAKPKILIHGGGKVATELSARLRIETQMVDGRRITDEATIKVVTMAYAGYINKNITAILQSKGCCAIGLSGVDARMVPAVKRPVKDIDYGWVGDIKTDEVNSSLLNKLLTDGLTPIIAPIACDDEGHLLNINADTVAQSIAVALSKVYALTLIYCFEKKGVLSDVADESSVIPLISISDVDSLKSNNIISKGMVPKIDNARDAVLNGVAKVVIGQASDISKIALNQIGYGTTISA